MPPPRHCPGLPLGFLRCHFHPGEIFSLGSASAPHSQTRVSPPLPAVLLRPLAGLGGDGRGGAGTWQERSGRQQLHPAAGWAGAGPGGLLGGGERLVGWAGEQPDWGGGRLLGTLGQLREGSPGGPEGGLSGSFPLSPAGQGHAAGAGEGTAEAAGAPGAEGAALPAHCGHPGLGRRAGQWKVGGRGARGLLGGGFPGGSFAQAR